MLLCLSVSVSVLHSGSEVIGSLVAVCLCVGSVSYLKCFYSACLPLALSPNKLPFTENSESISVDHRVFYAVAVSLFWCRLMLQILTAWIFIALCGSLVYWFHPR